MKNPKYERGVKRHHFCILKVFRSKSTFLNPQATGVRYFRVLKVRLKSKTREETALPCRMRMGHNCVFRLQRLNIFLENFVCSRADHMKRQDFSLFLANSLSTLESKAKRSISVNLLQCRLNNNYTVNMKPKSKSESRKLQHSLRVGLSPNRTKIKIKSDLQ